jgi:hypothetical protein
MWGDIPHKQFNKLRRAHYLRNACSYCQLKPYAGNRKEQLAGIHGSTEKG